jgi:ABC-type uncharacterized transport system substrate-binding protein
MVRAALALLALMLATAAAEAHPHVWIDMRSTVNFNDKGTIDAISVSWTFDEFYSRTATEDIDANNNKKLDADELQRLADSYAKNLKVFGYFMHIEAGDDIARTAEPTNATAVFTDGRLTIAFRLPFLKPIDPAATKLRYASFDPTYYVDIAPVGRDVAFTGRAPKNCSSAIRKVDSTHADALGLRRSVTMIAPTSDVLNATNAAVIDITCTITKAAKTN